MKKLIITIVVLLFCLNAHALTLRGGGSQYRYGDGSDGVFVSDDYEWTPDETGDWIVKQYTEFTLDADDSIVITEQNSGLIIVSQSPVVINGDITNTKSYAYGARRGWIYYGSDAKTLISSITPVSSYAHLLVGGSGGNGEDGADGLYGYGGTGGNGGQGTISGGGCGGGGGGGAGPNTHIIGSSELITTYEDDYYTTGSGFQGGFGYGGEFLDRYHDPQDDSEYGNLGWSPKVNSGTCYSGAGGAGCSIPGGAIIIVAPGITIGSNSYFDVSSKQTGYLGEAGSCSGLEYSGGDGGGCGGGYVLFVSNTISDSGAYNTSGSASAGGGSTGTSGSVYHVGLSTKQFSTLH